MFTRSPNRRVRIRATVAALAGLSLIAAACGSSDDSSSASSVAPTAASAAPDSAPPSDPVVTEPVESSPQDTTEAPDTSAAPDTAAVSDTAAPGPASGDPIVVGFVNMEAGPLAQPAIGDSARGAIAYINKYLGGVDGRPLEFDQCITDGSPEASAKCAAQFVTNGTEVVFYGLDFGDAAMLPTLEEAGIPLIGQEPITPADYQTGQWFAGSQVGYALGAAVFIRDVLAPTNVTVLTLNSATSKTNMQTFIIPSLEAAGVENIDVVEVDPTQPDFSVFVAAALANSPDLLYGFLQDTDCTKLVTTSRQLGYTGDILAGNCGAFAKEDPVAAEGVYALGDLYSPDDRSRVPERAQSELDMYLDSMAEFAPDRPISVFTQFVFAGIMNLHSILEQVGADNYSAENVVAAMAATDDAPSFMADTYSCSAQVVPDFPALCGASVLVFQSQDGLLVQVSDWIFGPDIYAGT